MNCDESLYSRWMKSWGANMASEGKQRSLMKSQLSELPVEGESVPFAFNLKRGGYELCPAPLAYANDLQSMLFHLLEEKQRLNQLTWHNGVIPDNEIWVKIGGDKGGSSFKTSIQVVNIDKPNSVRNSCVFVVFEAPDCSSNLHHKIHDQIDHLQNSCWRGYTIRVFMSGDYEFLCYMYGLSGASGMYMYMYMHIIIKFHLSIIRSSLLLIVFYITGPIKYSTCSTIQ
ncbi:PREDICTED: uncharacterized protein LOC109582205 [Amphimedon queenslandica]|uniref:Uncharacterized protein n=1 Tax=Amphimedon queenslandica TaxID=400682 RepID=A0AAN0J5W6_AMPQE|nr:PREDICTED: uncharacterized protein LOC109582205 [Amphimedon queenslandica]|eukprot:XP_019852415.1 PREDICTED: uncharacterized protein LOC109582205 [Amphimedon queenslandica]